MGDPAGDYPLPHNSLQAPNEMTHPTVNVIKSNATGAPQGHHSSETAGAEQPHNSAGATDGDTTKRTNPYLLDSNR